MDPITHLVPDTATLFEVAQQAAAGHLHLIHKGDRFALSPTIPPGWQQFAVADKGGNLARTAALFQHYDPATAVVTTTASH